MKRPSLPVKRPRLRRAIRFPAIGRRRIPSLRSLIVLVLLLTVGLVGIRLVGAPIDSAWLGRLAAARIADRLGSEWTVAVDILRLDFTQGPMPEISAIDVRLDAAARGLFIDIPRITGKPAASALYTGELDLGELRLDRPFVAVDRSKTQTPLLSGAEFAQWADAGIAVAIARLKKLGLDDVVVSNATFVLDGTASRTFETIDLTATVDAVKDTLSVNASVAGRDGRWTLQFAHGADETNGERWLKLSAADVTLTEFLPSGATARTGRGLGLPLFPQLTLRLNPDGTFNRGDLRVGVGGGYLSFQRDASVLIDEVLLHLSWSSGQQHVVLEPSYAVFGESQVSLRGEIKPPQEPGSALWEFAVEAPKARLRPRDVAGAPLILDNVLAFGSFDAANLMLNLDTFSVRAGAASVTAAGSVDLGSNGPLMALALSFGRMPVATAKRLWPSLVLPKARKWFIEHIDDGRINGGRLIVALDALGFDGDPATVGWTPDGVLLDFSFEGAKVKAIGDLPQLEGVAGTGAVRDGRLIVEATGGWSKAPGGGEIKVSRSLFTIPDLRVPDKMGQLDLSLSGEIGDIARVAALRPIDATEKLGFVPAALSGRGDVTTSVSFPLKRRFDRRLAEWTLAATLANFSSTAPISGQMIKNAELDVTASPSAAIIRGRGVLNGLEADIDVVQPLDGSKVGSGQGVVLNVDTKDLTATGIDFAGLVKGKFKISVRSREDGRRDMEADLAQAELKIAPVGWSKAAGVPATARFVLSERNGAQVIDDFVLTSEGVRIEGKLRLGKDGRLEAATFSQFALRDSDRARLTIKSTKNGGYRIDFEAERFDGRGLLASLKRGRVGDDLGKDLKLEAKVGRLTGFNGVEVTSFVASVSSKGGVIGNAEVSGLSNGRASVRGGIKPQGKQRTLSVQMADSGEVFRFLDIYDRMKGGSGTLSATLLNGTSSGRLVVTDLTIAAESGLKKILDANPSLNARRVSPGRDVENSRRITRAGGTSFQKLNVEFSKTGDRLTVREGTLKGAVLGGTLEGTIELEPQLVNLTGTFVPAYAVNNMFGQIPLLGQLVGGRNGGLLGVTFRVSGTLDDPVLSVNPMSAIAPGIFRKIFEFR